MVVASMTGFGRARADLSGRYAASVVVRAVNHRHLDVQVRSGSREELPEAEALARDLVAGALARGRVTVQLNLERKTSTGSRVLVDGEAVAAVLHQLHDLEQRLNVQSSVDVRDILPLPGMVLASTQETMLSEEELEALKAVVQTALEQLVAMRRTEGERLKVQIEAEAAVVAGFLDWLEPQLATVRERMLERLRARLTELLGSENGIDPQRLAMEAAMLADRADVAEETVRLHSHLAQLHQRLDEGGAIGRPLDFLCQEIHRELNTLGSKCREAGIAGQLVEARTAAERIREQVQNLE